MVFQEIAIFLISVLSSLYISAILLRLILAWARASFYNPLSQFLVKVTNPLLVPLRRVVPSVGKVDSAALVLALGLQFIAIILLMLLLGKGVDPLWALIAAAAELMRSIIWIFIIALIMQAVLSWVGNSYGNPVASLLDSITSPVLRPLRRFVPVIGMIDLSPLVAILLLNVLLIILRPLPSLGF